MGVAEGLTGRAYAIPTVDHMIRPLPLEAVRASVERFLAHARANPQTLFFVTRVGCGIAGFAEWGRGSGVGAFVEYGSAGVWPNGGLGEFGAAGSCDLRLCVAGEGSHDS